MQINLQVKVATCAASSLSASNYSLSIVHVSITQGYCPFQGKVCQVQRASPTCHFDDSHEILAAHSCLYLPSEQAGTLQQPLWLYQGCGIALGNAAWCRNRAGNR